MSLLVLTGSVDGTCDLLFARMGTKAFRFNFDIFDDYELEFTPDHWSVKNPAGLHISSETTSGAFWWKAFNFFIEGDAYLSEEVKYVFRELYAWHETRGMIKGNSPFFHHRRGKLMLLSAASQFFPIPRTQVGWRLPRATNGGETVIAKSLTSGLITSNKVMYSTEVSPEQLDPRFPWYLQEKIEADADVTIQ